MTATIGPKNYYAIDGIEFEEDEFGLFTDKTTGVTTPVRRFTWRNSNNMTVQVITYGATVTAIKVPDKNGNVRDVVMGFKDMEGYLNPFNPYFGATVGRVANRIGNALITIDDVSYKVSANLGPHQLHGGFRNFSKVNWKHYVKGTKVVLSYLSVDGEEGYPGDVLVNATFELNNNNEFLIDFKATTSKPTVVNLTNHSYFNLAGHNTGAEEMYKHFITINADKITNVNQDFIPTGVVRPVEDSVYDLRVPKKLGDVINRIPGYEGYDHNFCVSDSVQESNQFVAKAFHPATGRSLEVYSNQPGVQFYCSNSLPEDPKKFKGDQSRLRLLEGKDGPYFKHGAVCFETQNWPDAVNHKNFPPAVLYPGNTYHHTVSYKFTTNA